MRRSSGRGAASLAELLIAIALVAIVGLPVFSLLATTDHEAMTSEDYMQAEAFAQRQLADVLAMPWSELESGLPWKRDLASRQLQGTLKAEKLEDGLVALEVQLSWPVRPGSPARRRYGLVRLRARPELSIRASYPLGDGEGNR